MEKIYKHPENGQTFIITDPNHINLMERYGYEEVEKKEKKKK